MPIFVGSALKVPWLGRGSVLLPGTILAYVDVSTYWTFVASPTGFEPVLPP
jgi:hypothetical protein